MSEFDYIYGLHPQEIKIIQDSLFPAVYVITQEKQWRKKLRERKFEEYLNFSGPELERFWKNMRYIKENSLLEGKWKRQWQNLSRHNFKKFNWFLK